MRALPWLVLAMLVPFAPNVAEACGCFAAPTAATPVVQTGERIVFAVEDGEVVAHIQIQYNGDAEDFAWMVPVPSVPELKVGSESLFEALETATRPTFTVNFQSGEDCFDEEGCGFDGEDALFAAPNEADPRDSVAVVQSEAGPYEYAVVRADAKAPMFEWLAENGYFVPSASDASFEPYIRPGAFFLALKLRATASVGDLQPVVLTYPADRPMIPIVLTSMGATNNMGVAVWVLGSARAVPVNYQHVVVNDEHIQWANGADNYAEVVRRAIDEAEDHHAFVTEYAGPVFPARNAMNAYAITIDEAALGAIDPVRDFVNALQRNGFRAEQLIAILSRELRLDADDLDGRSGNALWEVYFGRARVIPREEFDSPAVAAEIFETIVAPLEEATALLGRHAYLTRLLTILSPDEMTLDPVFDFNPDLADVSNQRTVRQMNYCNDDGVELSYSDGRIQRDPQGVFRPKDGAPFAARVEVLGLEGAPTVVVDNAALITDDGPLDAGGCADVAPRGRGWGLTLLFAVVLGLRARRRRAEHRAS